VTDTLPPGPSLNWLAQSALIITGPRWLEHCQKRYGDRFTLRLGRFGTYVYLADPDDIKEVFRGDDSVFHAGEANAPFLGRVLGPSSVLVTDEEVHLRQRRRLSGPFHGASVTRLVPRMAAIAAADVGGWPVGRPFRVLDRMRAVTLEVILQTVIGVTDEERLAPLRSALLHLTDIPVWQMAQFPLPGLGRYRPWRSFWARKEAADRLLRVEFERARGDPALEERPDVLAMLLRHREPDGTAMTSDELRDQIVTLLLAGHETTATGLAWAVERLTRHPEVLLRATEAARRDDHAYLDAVVSETLRARPVVPDVSRRLTADVCLGGHTIPAGTYVDPAILLVHRSGRLYRDPDRFEPERFVGGRPDPTVWLPFGGGSRRCLGAAFAATEMRVVLGEILKRVDLAPTRARSERARMRHVTLAPHRGGTVVVAQRAGREPALVAGGEPAATGP
jgi:cytochrome P450